MGVSITFLGGVGTVTGSKYLLEHEGQRLLVDCGLFQGYKQLRLRNWRPLPLPPASIDAVVLTHAHLDHSGYLPLLVREGFAGRAWCTAGTRDLCHILLPDSGHIQEEDADYANRHGHTRHHPALPLYTENDARKALHSLRSVHPDESFEPLPGWQARLVPAGHILGAASLWLEVGGRRLLFSGDLGRDNDLLMAPPTTPPAADTVLIESTYGDRLHPPEDLLQELGPALSRVAARGGTAVVPVFAVGRAQAVMWAIHLLKRQGQVPHAMPVYLDSPMAIHTTVLYANHPGEHRLSEADCVAMAHDTVMVMKAEESQALTHMTGPKIILACSGMATGGRVLHHLKQYLGDHRNMVILTGYQAPGTRGATLVSGARNVRIHGQDVSVHAEIVTLHGASAHADAPGLLRWLDALPEKPSQVYVVHGDDAAADTLRQRIERELHLPAEVPEYGSRVPV